MDMDPDYPPPPAYSEQEFDQKVAQATELSVIPSTSVDQDGWERYDPAAFELTTASANAVNLPSSPPPSKGKFFNHHGIPANNNNSTSALPTIIPLRIEKKSQLDRDPYYNATVDRSGGRSPLPSVRQHSRSQDRPHEFPSSVSFPQQASIPLYSPASISQSHSSFAPTTSPELRWEDHSQRPLNDPYWTLSQRPSTQYPLPTTPDKRLIGVYPSYPSNVPHPQSVPLVPFDPTIAYERSASGPSQPLNAPASPAPTVHYDPYSLYNSVVSARMHPLRSSQGISHHPSSNEQFHNKAFDAPLRPVYPPHSFNNDSSSRVSQPTVINTARQSISWQTPSRPALHYPSPNPPHNFAAPTDINRYSHYSNG
ncbi:hypothetical protein CPB84DRAFT_1757929 [Gymnopilus junonius]|uniref:Uncharacterized protein n=1 Tax=Gymnopilus junonius TaxID=109634 RepID=A0A9P5NZI1_GYMJU|nr:hypothetical protein CPB84DRAFT_1757929 [Gymnopilus junonius]